MMLASSGSAAARPVGYLCAGWRAVRSLGTATGGWRVAPKELGPCPGEAPGPWLWRGAVERRRVNRLEDTASRVAAVGVSRARPARRAASRPG